MLPPKEGAGGRLTRHADNASELLRNDLQPNPHGVNGFMDLVVVGGADDNHQGMARGGVGSRRASFRASVKPLRYKSRLIGLGSERWRSNRAAMSSRAPHTVREPVPVNRWYLRRVWEK